MYRCMASTFTYCMKIRNLKKCSRSRSNGDVEEEDNEVSLIVVTNTGSCEEAVLVSLQNASVAQGAVMGPWGGV